MIRFGETLKNLFVIKVVRAFVETITYKGANKFSLGFEIKLIQA
jgi:hypothetical protein